MSTSVLVLAPSPPRAVPPLDEQQRAVVEHPADAGHLVVVGAPGSGKTTTAMALLERRVQTSRPHGDVLMLVPHRRAAARVRDEITTRMARTVRQVLVRTPASIAFSLLRARAAMLGEPPPTLVSGPEQDAILAELLAGHREGSGVSPQWPAGVTPDARGLRAFRGELRDVLMRAAEAGLSPGGLASLGRRRGRAEWVAAAEVWREYEHVLQLGQVTPDRGERFDAALILDEAVAALQSWGRVLPGSSPPRFGTVIVDDYQDATVATARLLRALAADGSQIVLLGDPDTAVQGFRGATPSLIGAATGGLEQPAGFAADRIVLPTVWRQHPALRAATAAVTERIAASGGVAHRRAGSRRDGFESAMGGADTDPAGVQVAIARTRAEEAALVAGVLRDEHVRRGTGYAEMAVVVRGGAQARDMRRRLAAAGVPVATGAADVALRESPAVASMLLAVGAALGDPLAGAEAAALLTSPLAGRDRLDPVSMRSLRRVLRGRTARGTSGALDDALVEVVSDVAAAHELPLEVRRGPARVARIIDAGRRAAREPAATAETVLWAAWAAAGLAEPWRSTALAGGPAGARADRDLDAVLQLFQAAERFTGRHPGADPGQFVRLLRQEDVPADSLAARAGREHVVEVLTPAAAAGQEWSVVVVAGLQEDVWPDLRMRGSLLGAHQLTEIATGRARAGRPVGWEERHDVLQDELRTFAAAVSRARRRLILTAVRDGDLVPSPFLDLVDPPANPEEQRSLAAPAPPLDLRGLVATLRAELPDGLDAATAAELLAELAERGVPGAHPVDWIDALPESTDEPLWRADEPVELSPSSLETAEECGLRWALERVGARRPPGSQQEVGMLVHAIAAQHPHGTYAELAAELDRRWPEVATGEGWAGRRQRELAERMVGRLAAYIASRPGRVDVEQVVEATVAGAVLRGRVDRLEHGADGAVRVVDLKTGSSAKSGAQAAADPQLAAYQAAIRAGALGDHVRPGGAALVYLGANKEAAQRHQGAPEDDWAEALVARIARTAAASSFTATVGEACRTCPVTSSCPARSEGARVGR